MRLTLTLSTVLLIATTASAQDWTGALNSDWNNPGNWSDWPLDGENITIDSANYTGVMADPSINATSVFTPDRLFVEDGHLTIAAGLSVADRFVVEGEGEVEQTNGALTTDRLIVGLGGLFSIANGSLSVTSVLAVADGSLTRPSTFSQVGGTVTILGELGFECEVGDHRPNYRITGGTLTVNGDALWTGESPGSGSGRLLVEDGTVVVRGDIVGDAGSTMDLYIGLSGGTLTTQGGMVELANGTDSIRITGGALHFDANLEIRNEGVLWSDPGDVYFDQQAELRGSGTYRFHSVTISSGANLQHTDPQEILVAAAWIDLGSFDPDGNTVAFIGQGPSIVSGGNFHGMRVATPSNGVQVVGTCTVAGPLSLEQGLVHTQSNDLLVLLEGATSTSGSITSHVNGPMRKIGGEAFVFPVGKNGSWRRLGIQDINDADTEFTAEYFPQPYGNTVSLSADLVSVSSVEHWTLTRTGSTDDARVQLFWEDASASGLAGCSGIAVAYWDGSLWQGLPSSVQGSCTGSGAGSVEGDAPVEAYVAVTIGQGTNGIGVEEVTGMAPPRLVFDGGAAWMRIEGLTTGTWVEVRDASGRSMARTQEHTLPTGSWSPGAYVLSALGSSWSFLLVR